MASVVVNGDTSGSVTLSAPAVAGTVTVTLPAASGTMLTTASTFAGTGPAFSAYLSTNQTVTGAVITQIQLDTETFDTASCYNNTGATVGGIPAYSFLPNVAGYYQVNLLVGGTAGTTMSYAGGHIYKNGSAYTRVLVPGYSSSNADSSNSVVIYMNGTTDYLSFSAQVNGTGTIQVAGNQTRTTASAALIRAA